MNELEVNAVNLADKKYSSHKVTMPLKPISCKSRPKDITD